jgi:undecaprenyl pyrophosphate synthase
MVINNYKKVFFAPNTSDQEIIQKAKKILVENGINEKDIQINYNTNELEEGDLFISYDPPDLVVRNVYQKKLSGIIKMKSLEMLRMD